MEACAFCKEKANEIKETLDNSYYFEGEEGPPTIDLCSQVKDLGRCPLLMETLETRNFCTQPGQEGRFKHHVYDHHTLAGLNIELFEDFSYETSWAIAFDDNGFRSNRLKAQGWPDD